MPKRKTANSKSDSPITSLLKHKHHFLAPTAGGVAAYLFTGVIIIGLVIAAVVWFANLIGSKSHQK